MRSKTEPREATAAEVREWASKRGFQVGARGHLPERVIKQFNAKHSKMQFVSRNPSVVKASVEAEAA